MMQWEYLAQGAAGNGSLGDVLNDYGKDGWELINVIRSESKFYGDPGKDIWYALIFKRPLPPPLIP